MAGIIQQAMLQQALPQQTMQPKQPQAQQMALLAARLLYQGGEAVAQRLMADGRVDEDEAGDLAVNLMVAANNDHQKETGEETDPRTITFMLPAVCLLVAEFAERIGGLPEGRAGAFARKMLPSAIARFKTRFLNQAQGIGPVQATPQQGMSQQGGQQSMPQMQHAMGGL
ncbi:hypothetical protein IGB42_01931 [Andreprevotia sp. IGB-42]|uniref:hypothetical protein n=1 Tax=Andreprevotia sp. IGB-42 TaxID=2497473 RepID=UPI001357A115|nr:hypothetical protein [Andreprevotia sp. IGB-42]KAF0813580.1 hypothetical protein IGB42_01931 [Andreprevotia sp. IGB-42]